MFNIFKDFDKPQSELLTLPQEVKLNVAIAKRKNNNLSFIFIKIYIAKIIRDAFSNVTTLLTKSFYIITNSFFT